MARTLAGKIRAAWKRTTGGHHHRTLGDQARDRGDWAEAVVRYRAYLQKYPDVFAIWVQLGHTSKEAGDPAAAEQAYLRALKLGPNDPDLLLNLGHLMKSQGRLDEAIDHYARSELRDTTGAARIELDNLRKPGGASSVTYAAPPARMAPRRLTASEDPSPFLKGSIELPVAPSEGDATLVRLVEGGYEIARGYAEGAGQRQFFAIRLPDAVCDGRPHGFGIMVEDEIVARIATITPAHLTPALVLDDYVSSAMRRRTSVVAGWRYGALAEQAEALAKDPSRGVDWPTIAAAHRFLVSGPIRAGLDERFEPLAFDVVDAPAVSVIIPVHNSFAYTYRCLASLRIMPNAASFEIVLVDDGSSDRTTEIESLVSGIRVVRHETAQGFVGACNAGVAEARGGHVVLLNNDTEVSPHWIDRLLEPFDLYDDVGLTGAKLIYADGRLQEAGGLVWRDGRASNYGRLGSAADPRYNFLRETDYCSGACIMVPRALWDDLGGFDTEFAPAYYEDTDLAFRIRAGGLKILYQPLAEILHFEGVSNGIDLGAGMKRHQALNQPKFLERWGNSLRSHGEPGADETSAVERSYPRRVLVIDDEIPQPDRSAGAHAAVQEIRLLQSLGYRPTFLPRNLAFLGRYNDMLAAMGVETIHAPFYLSMEEFISARGHEFDLVYITRYAVAEAVLPLIRHHCPDAPVVFNNADLHFLRAIRDAMDDPDEAKRADARAVREAELAVMCAVNLTLSYSHVEHAVIQSHTMGDAKVALCPWVVEPRPAGPTHAEREGIAFLGGYRHPPNRKAVEFFVRDVMPVLRKLRPGIKFHVYGSFPPPEFAELAADDVIIEGFVERVEDAFDRSRVFVAPLRTGAGIKGKVLEAFGSGIPSVLSPIAAEGLGVRDGLEVAIAETPQQWGEAIATLYDDPAAWAAMSDAATKLVTENYSFERAREILKRGFNENGIATLTGITCRHLPR